MGVQTKNEAETLGYQVEKQLSELKEKMSTEDAEDLKKQMEDLKQYMAGDSMDLEELKTKTKDLQEKSWKVTQQAYASGSNDADTSEEKKEDAKEEKKDAKEEKK